MTQAGGITDVVMPGLDGLALAERLGERHPALGVLFMSGFAEDLDNRRRPNCRGFLPKPFSMAELLGHLRGLRRTILASG